MTISRRNPSKDTVAIAAAATTGFQARNTDRSPLSYAVDVSIQVLRSVGMSGDDVDGIVGSGSPSASHLQRALGIPEVTYFADPPIPIMNQLSSAVAAVHSGLCEVALVYHVAYRLPWNSGSATQDPFRRRVQISATGPEPESLYGSVGYAAWASRYLHEHRLERVELGLIALNDRANAAKNPAAAMRDPLTMEEYERARMVREPLCLFDMDPAVDGADAFVVTTAERARDLPHPPVLVHAVTLGMIDKNDEAQTPSLRRHGQHVVVEALRSRSDFWIEACDLYFPYDGFSIIALNWIENVGFCEPGGAPAFMREHWDEHTGRVLIHGRVPLNPHGGSLSEGATQGSGHLREAVHQLQGLGGQRQVESAERAIVTTGGFFFNAQGCTLRRD